MGSGKAVGGFVAVLVASFAVMNALSADGLQQACLQEALLAAVAIGGVALACPRAIRHAGCASGVRDAARVAAAVAVAGALGGAITLAAWGFADPGFAGPLAFAGLPSSGELVRRLALLVATCALTGAFEETFMRVLAVEAFESLTGEGGEDAVRATRRAVLASALLFALLHVGMPGEGSGAVMALQTLAKFVQALLFGLVMGVLYARTRSLWPCAAAHAGFDALYLGPGVVLTGELPATYASGLPVDSVLLGATTVLLAVLAGAAWKSWGRGVS